MSHDREESKGKNRNHVVTDYRPSTHVARDPGDEGVPSLSLSRARARARSLNRGGEGGEPGTAAALRGDGFPWHSANSRLETFH